jgi:hypothetical protein
MAIIVLLVVGAITAYYASWKGYNPLIWFFAGGVIGLVLLLLLPNVNDPSHFAHERAQLTRNGNIVGGVLVVISVVIGFMLAFGGR